MKNSLKYMALSSLLALVGSCQQQDPIQELAAKSNPQKANADLVDEMSSNERVRSFVLANERFLNEDEAYYNNLSDAGKAARRADLQAQFESGAEFTDPYRTPAQVDAHHASQEALAAQIRAAFPQLYRMPERAQDSVKRLVYRNIMANSSQVVAATAPGHAAYAAAVWYGQDAGSEKASFGAGRAFYNGYMGYIQ
ncbi:hypothetical protein ACFST9_23520 [Hymenobacter monticola]|uniref:Uncharacterized protein n=1 Tax=Hymenobacter monticola TaxID=1705399 RepID=A0ABY4B559_9BACT|nr:hypothetical protein [Hymenobacter monticola]UOE33929.1 hypothetical protein MTP16_22800 [Hymenobacter monticola]